MSSRAGAVDRVDLSTVQTRAELALALNVLRRSRGLSYERMEKAAARLQNPGARLPKSTVGDIVKART